MIYDIIFIIPHNYIGLYLLSCRIFIYNFFTYDFNAFMFYLNHLFLARVIITCLYLFIIHDVCGTFPCRLYCLFGTAFLVELLYIPIEIIIIIKFDKTNLY